MFNLSYQFYIYLLYFLIIFLFILGFYFYKNIKTLKTKIIILWILLLYIFNLVIMISTIKNYLKNKNKIGTIGPTGDIGFIGKPGKNNICNECEVFNTTIYGGNTNDLQQKVVHPKIKIGKCDFPFVFEGEYKYDCIKNKNFILDNNLNEVSTDGWCATEKDSQSFEAIKFGYCNNSKNTENFIKSSKSFQEQKNSYKFTNTGLIDLKLIKGIRSSAKCPKNYNKIDFDLNYDTEQGDFLFLCTKFGLTDKGIVDLKIAKSCPSNYFKVNKNIHLNQGINSAEKLNICLKKDVEPPFIKDIKIIKTSEEKNYYTNNLKYKCIDKNLNSGSNAQQIFLCFNKKEFNKFNFINFIFVWTSNNQQNMYAFKNDSFFKINNLDNISEDSKQLQKINTFWGRLPSNLDTAYFDSIVNKTYFFKGEIVYTFNPKQNIIQQENLIDTIWPGVPSYLDSVFLNLLENKLYFIKNDLYYEWDYDTKKIIKIDKLNNKWGNSDNDKPSFPSNISSMFIDPLDNIIKIKKEDKLYNIENFEINLTYKKINL